MADYMISIRTGDLPGAWTCEQVYMTLIGTKGKSEELELRKPYRDGFGQGQTDAFLVRDIPELGEVTQVQIRLSPYDLMTAYVKAWYLEQIHVGVSRTGNIVSTWSGQCDTWLGVDAGQQLICAVPVTAHQPTNRARDKVAKIDIARKRSNQSSHHEQPFPIAAQPKDK